MCSRNSFESRDSDWISSRLCSQRCVCSCGLGDVELAARLVQPVRGDAGLGDAMHVLRSDLRLQRRAERAEQRRMQRLVGVRLRNGDVILELAGDRLVEVVQHAQRRVAGGRVLDQDAHAVNVEHLRERIALLAHFLVDAVDRLFSSGHRRRDVGLLQAVADRLQDPVHHFAPVAARGLDRLGQHPVARRMQMLERQLLQLEVQRVEAETIGDRRVDVQRLAGDPLAMRRAPSRRAYACCAAGRRA